MKKVLFTFALVFSVIFTTTANSNYYVNDTEVETLLEESIQVNPFENSVDFANFVKAADQSGDKNAWIAVIIDLLIGGLAIHRVYLDGTPLLILGYLFTFGGIFGLLPLGDLIVLIINNQDISKYVGSDAFIMW